MNRYDWIVFDSTGTLMTPDPEPAVVYQQVASQHGLVVSVDETRVNLKAAMRKHFFGETAFSPTSESNEYQRWQKIVADTLPGLSRTSLSDAFKTLWNRFADADQWRMFEDVVPCISMLREKGYAIAVASNFDGRLRTILESMEKMDLFDEVLISSDLGWSKPNPKFYHVAQQRLKSSDSNRLLMIGDTPRGDVDAAIEAGWEARLLVRGRENSLEHLIATVL